MNALKIRIQDAILTIAAGKSVANILAEIEHSLDNLWAIDGTLVLVGCSLLIITDHVKFDLFELHTNRAEVL